MSTSPITQADSGIAGPLVLVDAEPRSAPGAFPGWRATLTVKVIAHHGHYSRYRVGRVEQLHGTDVIVLYRLAKNRIPSHEYVLATAALVERLLPEQAASFVRVDEPVADLGLLSVGYRDFAPLRALLQ